jgi:hypothetical protein
MTGIVNRSLTADNHAGEFISPAVEMNSSPSRAPQGKLTTEHMESTDTEIQLLERPKTVW